MKLYILVVLAALSSFSLSACGGANTTTGLADAPAANEIAPLTSTVEVTALNGGTPDSWFRDISNAKHVAGRQACREGEDRHEGPA